MRGRLAVFVPQFILDACRTIKLAANQIDLVHEKSGFSDLGAIRSRAAKAGAHPSLCELRRASFVSKGRRRMAVDYSDIEVISLNSLIQPFYREIWAKTPAFQVFEPFGCL